MFHKVFLLKPKLRPFEPVSSKNIRKRFCYDSYAPLGFVPSKIYGTNNWRTYWCFNVKLLQIHYNNKKGCNGVNYVLGFVQSY